MGHRKRKQHTTPATACLNCGAVLSGAYCSACGQSAHEGREPSLGHFLHDLVHEFLHVDGKLFQTLWALLLKPGLLTDEYWRGRMGSWIRPIRLFLVAVAIHWLASTGVGPLNLQVLLEREPNGEFSVSIASEPSKMAGKNGRVPATAAEHDEFLEKFKHRYAQIRYSSVLIFAAASWLLYRRRQRYYVNHLVGALHFYALWYLVAIFGNELMGFDARLGGVGMLLSGLYLLLALRRLYAESWVRTVLKASLLMGALGFIELLLGSIAASVVASQGGLS
ncbi:MAG: DUF3667 domain-containing protein [Vicinamibacteria bacterium]|nr:DUF3667 domain-containing protein [Vicinamibacteria bacterium]